MELVFVAIALAGGAGAGYGAKNFSTKQKIKNSENKANKILEDAKTKAKADELAAKEQAIKLADEAKKE